MRPTYPHDGKRHYQKPEECELYDGCIFGIHMGRVQNEKKACADAKVFGLKAPKTADILTVLGRDNLPGSNLDAYL